MPMKSTHRRNQFFARKLWRPQISEYACEYAVKMRPWHCKHVNLLRGIAVLIVATIIFAVEATPRAQELINPPKPAPMKQSKDHEPRSAQKVPTAFSDDTITITFHNCRENAKGHWSCQRVDGEDTDHYVYIPGLHPTHTRTASTPKE